LDAIILPVLLFAGARSFWKEGEPAVERGVGSTPRRNHGRWREGYAEVAESAPGEMTPGGVGSSGPNRQFPGRLGRRLGLSGAGSVVGFLALGALSFVLTRNVARLHRLVDDERLHIKAVDDIDAAFHHLIFEMQQSQIGGSRDPGGALPLHAQLVEALTKFRGLHALEEGLPEDGEERASFDALWNAAAALGPMAALIESKARLPSVLDSQVVERLRSIGDEIPGRLANLNRAHEARVTHLLGASDKVQRAILILYLTSFCIGGILIAVAGRVFHSRIAVPLRTLAASARRLASGERAVQVPVPSADEIGLVSHAFNVMSESLAVRERDLTSAQARLQQKLHELEVLNRIGTQMLGPIGIKERDAILQSIAEEARSLLSMDASVIWLATTEPDALTIEWRSGAGEAFQEKAGTMPHAAPCDCGPDCTVAECPVWRPEYFRTHLAFPLQRGGGIRGVLCVASREARTLGTEAREWLSALAAQTAVTVEQSRLNAEVQRLAVFEERGRIAREMHDGLAQAVSLLHLRIRQAQARLAPDQPLSLGNSLEEMAAISSDMYDEIRRSIVGLRTTASAGSGFAAALKVFLTEFSAQSRLPVVLEADDAASIHLPQESESQVIRIVQEALNNVHKHAGVDHARVRVERQDASLCVSVQDQGRGFDPAQVTTRDTVHFGLQGMRERAESLGGTLVIETAPGRGTRVTATVPLEPSQ
jgi:signal transduction histidine kinase